jgi:hypothetical protein
LTVFRCGGRGELWRFPPPFESSRSELSLLSRDQGGTKLQPQWLSTLKRRGLLIIVGSLLVIGGPASFMTQPTCKIFFFSKCSWSSAFLDFVAKFGTLLQAFCNIITLEFEERFQF